MPFKKRNVRSRKAPSKGTVRANTKKIASLTKKVNKQETPSNVFIEPNQNLDITTTPTVELLDVSAALPSTATTTKTILNNFWVKGLLDLQTGSEDTEIARIVIVQDMRKFDNNTAPLWLDVFDTTSVYSHRADTLGGDKKRSFKVLHDKTFTMVRNTDGSVRNRVLFSMFTRFGKNGLRQFDYSDYSQGLLYIMYVSTTATTVMDLNFDLKISQSKDS